VDVLAGQDQQSRASKPDGALARRDRAAAQAETDNHPQGTPTDLAVLDELNHHLQTQVALKNGYAGMGGQRSIPTQLFSMAPPKDRSFACPSGQ
jgi:hypothetical protein